MGADPVPVLRHWCVTCRTSERLAYQCFTCNRPGVRSFDPPEGWDDCLPEAPAILPQVWRAA
jgi:hypothetical protein